MMAPVMIMSSSATTANVFPIRINVMVIMVTAVIIMETAEIALMNQRTVPRPHALQTGVNHLVHNVLIFLWLLTYDLFNILVTI